MQLPSFAEYMAKQATSCFHLSVSPLHPASSSAPSSPLHHYFIVTNITDILPTTHNDATISASETWLILIYLTICA
jgi:hypothetical protein